MSATPSLPTGRPWPLACQLYNFLYTVETPCAARKVVRLRLRGFEVSQALVHNLRTHISGGGGGGYFGAQCRPFFPTCTAGWEIEIFNPEGGSIQVQVPTRRGSIQIQATTRRHPSGLIVWIFECLLNAL